jgi:hypothetical protein
MNHKCSIYLIIAYMIFICTLFTLACSSNSGGPDTQPSPAEVQSTPTVAPVSTTLILTAAISSPAVSLPIAPSLSPTGAAPSTTYKSIPSIVRSAPMPNTYISLNDNITVTFDQPMDPATINDSSFTVKNLKTSKLISGKVSFDNSTYIATFNPITSLDYGASYQFTISTAAASLSGKQIANTFDVSFYTYPSPYITPTSPTASPTRVVESLPPLITPTPPTGMKTYVNTIDRWSIAYPQNWVVIDSAPENVQFKPDNVTLVTVRRGPNNVKSLSDYVDNDLRLGNVRLAHFTILSRQPLSLPNNISAIDAVVTFTPTSTETEKGHLVYALRGTQVYTIETLTWDTLWNSLNPYFTKLINSFMLQ